MCLNDMDKICSYNISYDNNTNRGEDVIAFTIVGTIVLIEEDGIHDDNSYYSIYTQGIYSFPFRLKLPIHLDEIIYALDSGHQSLTANERSIGNPEPLMAYLLKKEDDLYEQLQVYSL